MAFLVIRQMLAIQAKPKEMEKCMCHRNWFDNPTRQIQTNNQSFDVGFRLFRLSWHHGIEATLEFRWKSISWWASQRPVAKQQTISHYNNGIICRRTSSASFSLANDFFNTFDWSGKNALHECKNSKTQPDEIMIETHAVSLTSYHNWFAKKNMYY